MWAFILRFFKRKEKKKEWLYGLFDNIEQIKNFERIVPFEIVDIKAGGFKVKTRGLFGFVPVRLMPWQYEKIENWEAIMFSLKESVFYGYVYRTEDSEDRQSKRVFVKADSVFLNKAELKRDEEYAGIVIQKIDYGVFVDIGHHFKWRCGSIVGFVHQSKFQYPESFHKCEMGHIVTISLIEKTEKGLSFKESKYVDLHEKYLGKTVQVTVYKDGQNDFEFWIDDKYPAKMPLWTSIYGQDLMLIKKALKLLPTGAIINGEVIDIKTNNTLIIKMSSQNDALGKAELHIQELKAYSGKTVRARIVKKEYNEVSFLIDDKYNAVLPLNEAVYNKDLNAVEQFIEKCSDGDCIDCLVTYVDYPSEVFTLKYLYDANLNAFIGKTVKVSVERNENGDPAFWVNNTFKAHLPVTEAIYGDNLNLVEKVVDVLIEGDKIDCEVIDVNNNMLIIKLLLHNKIFKKIVTQPDDLEKYVGKIVKVHVSRNQDNGLDFKVENRFNAILPIRKCDYGANVDMLSRAVDFWLATGIIDCEVLRYDKAAGLFVLKWRQKDKKWSGDDWHSVAVKYLRKIVFVHVYMNDNKEPVFFVDNKYRAVLEGESSGIEQIKNRLFDGAIIHCKVSSFNRRGYFTINRMNTGISHAKTLSSELSLDKMTYSQLLKKKE